VDVNAILNKPRLEETISLSSFSNDKAHAEEMIHSEKKNETVFAKFFDTKQTLDINEVGYFVTHTLRATILV
jgi:hypothetical protein